MIAGTISDTEALRLLADTRNQLVTCLDSPQLVIVDGNAFIVSPPIKVITAEVNNEQPDTAT